MWLIHLSQIVLQGGSAWRGQLVPGTSSNTHRVVWENASLDVCVCLPTMVGGSRQEGRQCDCEKFTGQRCLVKYVTSVLTRMVALGSSRRARSAVSSVVRVVCCEAKHWRQWLCLFPCLASFLPTSLTHSQGLCDRCRQMCGSPCSFFEHPGFAHVRRFPCIQCIGSFCHVCQGYTLMANCWLSCAKYESLSVAHDTSRLHRGICAH